METQWGRSQIVKAHSAADFIMLVSSLFVRPSYSQSHSARRCLACSTLSWSFQILTLQGIFLRLDFWIEFSEWMCKHAYMFKLCMIWWSHQLNMKSCSSRTSECLHLESKRKFAAKRDLGPLTDYLEKATKQSLHTGGISQRNTEKCVHWKWV